MAAWWEERLVRHAVVVEVLEAVVAVVIAAWSCDDLVGMRAIGACGALHVLWRVRDSFDAALPLLQLPAKSLKGAEC